MTLAKSLQSAAGNAAGATYIEDVFSTWLYTGTGAAQTINNGIDLAGEGGLVWVKSRTDVFDNILADTEIGVQKYLSSNTTTRALGPNATALTSFNANGFSIGALNDYSYSGINFASWTFRKQPKFFDVLTWTGDGVSGRQITHNLGSAPGAVFIKCTSSARNWRVWHRSFPTSQSIILNSTAAVDGLTNILNSTAPTSTTLTLSANTDVNANGSTYVAYLFAHNAGGFGLTGTDNVISCGSFTTDGSGNATVNLGYEPQWVLFKRSSGTDDWYLNDTMRGMSETTFAVLKPNLSASENAGAASAYVPTATGFKLVGGSGYASSTYIYIAIRRGPMKVPESGTEVFSPNAVNGPTGTQVTTGFPVDVQIGRTGPRNANEYQNIQDRLRGISTNSTSSGKELFTNTTDAETNSTRSLYWNSTGFQIFANQANQDVIYWSFLRAPGFMDEVCYTGDATTPRTINHNLGVAPELIITKQRDALRSWPVRITALGDSVRAFLNLTNAASASASVFPVATYTSSTYVIGSDASVNASGGTYVAYLFASCPGVSKVFSYTGNGSSQTINCGFTGGARFVLIKRTDSTGDWYVWDTARGIVANSDPHLSLNTTAAEVTTDDSVDADSTGFIVNQLAATNINVSSATYIGLAIA